MTGEMGKDEVTRDRFPALFKLKDEIKRRFDVEVEARPYDQYQGAYLRIDHKIKVWMDGDNWKTGSLNNKWYFEGVEYEDNIYGGSGVYDMLEAEGYTRKNKSSGQGWDNLPDFVADDVIRYYKNERSGRELTVEKNSNPALMDWTVWLWEDYQDRKQSNHLPSELEDFPGLLANTNSKEEALKAAKTQMEMMQ